MAQRRHLAPPACEAAGIDGTGGEPGAVGLLPATPASPTVDTEMVATERENLAGRRCSAHDGAGRACVLDAGHAGGHLYPPPGWTPPLTAAGQVAATGRAPRHPVPPRVIALGRLVAALGWAAAAAPLLWLGARYLLGPERAEPNVSWEWLALRAVPGLSFLLLAYLIGVRRSRWAATLGALLMALAACAWGAFLGLLLLWLPGESGLAYLAMALVPVALALANWVARGPETSKGPG